MGWGPVEDSGGARSVLQRRTQRPRGRDGRTSPPRRSKACPLRTECGPNLGSSSGRRSQPGPGAEGPGGIGGASGGPAGRGRLWTQRPTRLELQAQPPDATSPTKRGTLSPGKTGSPGPATRASNPERVRLKSRLLLTTGKRLPACAARVGGNGPCSPSEAMRNPRARRHVDLVTLEAPRPRSHRTGVPIERTRPDESVTRVDQALLRPTCEMSPRPGQRCALPSLPRSGCGDGGL